MTRLRILSSALAVALLTAIATPADARPAKIPGDRFLSWSDEHKETYIAGLMDAEDHLVETCDPDASAAELAEYLTRWIEEHPSALREPAHRAFVRALSDKCNR